MSRSSKGSKTWLALLVAAALLVGARSAVACSVCLSGGEQTREAYYISTVLMMLSPFLVLGLLIFWLRRMARAQRAG
jgi:lipopolysaccharide export LptBFGC system permease protein LptF